MMQLKANKADLEKFRFDDVAIDPFWNTSQSREQKIHRIHAYPAKFPAFITTKALAYAKSEGYAPEAIADIFCGCGTTAIEAKRNNMAFWGCDINPVATLIAKVKSRKYVAKTLKLYFKNITSNYESSQTLDEYDAANERLKYWYFRDQYNELLRLKRAILKSTPATGSYRDFFLVAFSNILKPTSRWLTKSIKPQIDPDKVPAAVLPAFNEQVKMMFSANDELKYECKTSSTIVTGSFLEQTKKIPGIDMIVTSPPYVTSYEYADLHQLSSLWLDYVDDYRELRNGTIGSLHHEYNFNRELKRLNNTGHKTVALLLDQHKRKARSVAKYFLDIQKVAARAFEMLNPGGIALFVIGNTEYKNVRINNAKHLCESLIDSGFVGLNITKRKISNKILTPYRDERGKFTTDSSARKIYSEEFIVIARKDCE